MDKPDELNQTFAAFTYFQSAYYPIVSQANDPTAALLRAALIATERYLPKATSEDIEVKCSCKEK